MTKRNTGLTEGDRIIVQFLIASERALPILRELASETLDGQITRRAAHAIKALDLLEKAVLTARGTDENPVTIEHFTRSIL